MIRRILLDVDGVLVNFVQGACQLFGKNESDIMANWPKGEESMCKALGHTQEELWNRIEAAGPEFWIELPIFPWAKDLYALCQKTAPTAFLTTPSPDPGSLAGKFEWIRKFTGQRRPKNFLIGNAKEFCGCMNHLLIDDQKKNLETFDGPTIFFPRPPNDIPDDYCAYVKKKFDLFCFGEYERDSRSVCKAGLSNMTSHATCSGIICSGSIGISIDTKQE